MTREDIVRESINEAKRPKTKAYLAVLVGIAVVLAFYFVVFYGADFNLVNVNNPAAAQRTASDISSGVGQVSDDINGIDHILGSG